MEQRRLGFTLIELLVAVSIFSVIAIALYSSFNAGIRVWRRAGENMELHQSVRLTLEGMAKELRNAIDFTEEEVEGSEEGEGEGEGLVEKPDLLFFGSRDELSFITLATRPLDEGKFRKELVKVSYSLNAEDEFSCSAAFQTQGFIVADSDGEILVTDVEELKFEYSYQSEEEESPPVWKDYWENQEGIPSGVKIRLTVKRKEGIAGDFSKTVFIPTGILGKEEEEISE